MMGSAGISRTHHALWNHDLLYALVFLIVLHPLLRRRGSVGRLGGRRRRGDGRRRRDDNDGRRRSLLRARSGSRCSRRSVPLRRGAHDLRRRRDAGTRHQRRWCGPFMAMRSAGAGRRCVRSGRDLRTGRPRRLDRRRPAERRHVGGDRLGNRNIGLGSRPGLGISSGLGIGRLDRRGWGDQRSRRGGRCRHERHRRCGELRGRHRSAARATGCERTKVSAGTTVAKRWFTRALRLRRRQASRRCARLPAIIELGLLDLGGAVDAIVVVAVGRIGRHVGLARTREETSRRARCSGCRASRRVRCRR